MKHIAVGINVELLLGQILNPIVVAGVTFCIQCNVVGVGVVGLQVEVIHQISAQIVRVVDRRIVRTIRSIQTETGCSVGRSQAFAVLLLIVGCPPKIGRNIVRKGLEGSVVCKALLFLVNAAPILGGIDVRIRGFLRGVKRRQIVKLCVDIPELNFLQRHLVIPCGIIPHIDGNL